MDQENFTDPGRHEALIQDRILGLRVVELVKKYNLTGKSVHKILNDNKERIAEERRQIFEDRQEAINKALEDERETIVRLVTKTGKLLEDSVDILAKRLKKPDELKTSSLINLVDAATKSFEKVRAVIATYQKDSVDAPDPEV